MHVTIKIAALFTTCVLSAWMAGCPSKNSGTASDEPSSTVSSSSGGAASSTSLPPPDDKTRNHIGMNMWFLTDWDGSHSFVDAMKHSRAWSNVDWNGAAEVDELGWPKQDCSTVIFAGRPGSEINGTYRLVYKGQADVSLMWMRGSVSALAYDPSTNVSTADVTINVNPADEAAGGLKFTNTKRTPSSAVNTGITDIRLYRPGYPTDGSVVFTSPLKNALHKVEAVRTMNWTATNRNTVQQWAQRTTPLHATQAGHPGPAYTIRYKDGHTTEMEDGDAGVAIEHHIQLANEAGVDLWINIPVLADDDYIRNPALTILYGSDGTNPYHSPQSNPVFSPLNPERRVYVEYANEIWNSAGGFWCFHIIQGLVEMAPANHPVLNPPGDNVWYMMWRYPAWRLGEASRIFRSVFGDGAMMTRVRPVLMTQAGNGQATLSTALTWADQYYSSLNPPIALKDLFWGAGGAMYYGVNTWSTNPDAFFAHTNFPAEDAIRGSAEDATWAMNWGLKRVAYEGGMGLDARGGNGQELFNDDARRALNADTRMQQLTEATHRAWSKAGGELLMYYVLRGPPSWEFTPAMDTLDSPKLRAIDSLNGEARAPVELGTRFPGTLVVLEQYADGRMRSGYDYKTQADGQDVLGGNDEGEWIILAGYTNADTSGSLTVRGSSSSATIRVWINGSIVGTVTLADTNNHLADSSALVVPLPEGLVAIRLEALQGGYNLHSVTVSP